MSSVIVAMEQLSYERPFCSDSFFNLTEVWGSDFKLSECFQFSMLIFPGLTLFCMFILSVLFKKHTWNLPIALIKFGILQCLRMVLCFGVAVCVITLLISTICMEVSYSVPIDSVQYFSMTILFVSVVFYMLMVEYKRRACQPRSQMLFAFTCLIIVCMLPRLYGLLYAGRGWYNQSTFYWLHAATISVYICLAFGELLIQFFSPFNEQNSLLDDKDACPELWASVPALWTFNWLTSTIWKGFRGQINSPSDMFHIRPEDSVNKSYGRFKRAWNRSYNLWFKRKEPETPFSNVMDDDVPLLMDFKENNEDTENVSNDANMLNATPDVDILSPSTTNNNSNSYNLEVCKQSTIKASPARATWGLFYALISSFGLRLFCGWIFISAAVFFNYSSPLLLGMLLRFLSKPEAPLWQGYFIAFSMLFLQSISVLVDQKGFYSCLSLGISVRSALTSAIYRKSLRLSSEARSQYTTGELINLLSVDVNRIKELFMFSFLVWDAFIEFGLSFILLWRQLGSAAIAGVGFLLLVLPLNCLLIWATQKFEIREMKYKDKRMKCLGEVLAAIRVVKLYAWEKAFQSQVKSIRQSELTELLRVALGWGLCHVVWNLAPYIILLITFVTYLREFLFANHNVLLDNWVGNTTDIPTPQLLTPERIFVSVSLFNLLRSPLLLLPWSLSSSIMAFVSIRRLGLFLLADELEHYSSDKIYPLDEKSTDAIIFENASFSWTKTGPLALQNLNVRISRGWLVAIVGNVGSGKSSFLSACLSDMFKRSGKVSVKGSIAYVSQTAWIQQQSLRENIRFITSSDPTQSNPVAEQIEELWYKNVISACALETDIAHLPAGDKTEIGEKGVNLSGGQKQRVSLARAVYQRSDIYLLDDPLSAVDTHVGKYLFDHVLGPNGLLKDKTRIMTTNSFHWLSLADWIIVLNTNGEITQSGTYNEVVNNNSGHFTNYLESIEKNNINDETMNEGNQRKISFTTPFNRSSSVVVPPSSPHPIEMLSRSPPMTATKKLSLESPVPFPKLINFADINASSTTSKHDNNDEVMATDGALNDLIDFRSEQEVTHRRSAASISTTDLNASTSDNDKLENDDVECGKFMTDEEIMHGHVSWSTYWEYFRARSVSVTFISVLSYAGFLGVQAFCSYWLQWFADDQQLIEAEQAFQNTTIISNETARQILIEQIKDRILYYIIGYAWAGLGQTVLILLFALLNAYSNLRASNLLHQHLLSKILHAPASFFDHTPLGRILNRFSNDVDNLDHTIPNSFSDTIGTTGDVLISLMIVTVTLRPFGIGLAVIIPVFIFCITVLVFYMPSVRQTRRLDANTRSPLLTNYSETSASSLGVTVVRAFKRDKEFIAKSDKLIDANAVFEYVRFVANRWLDVHLNLSCSFMVFVCAIILVAFRPKISPGIAGLIIVYALQVFDSLTWVIKQLSQLETSSVSLERICEYIRVEQEADWDHGVDSPPPIDWPRPCCEITFNKATVQYHLPTKNKVTDNHDLSVSQKTSSNSGRLVTALKSIDLKLSGNPQERRIGIVGRTGAGKSSLASSIFRLIEPTILEEDRLDTHRTSTKRGPIVVDGVDLSRIGLHELRSRFSILPQEPIIFAGTLRFNLDPFGKLPDIDLWRAIESAHLADWVRSTNAGLDYECGEGGANLSAGQRQLVCLARVFLSSGGRVRLLILDEATAAMDPSTDNLVMNTVIGDIFKDATVIIIAHRLSTVMNTDRIVVLDHGQVIETGHPQDLLNNPNSHFSIMNKVKQS